MKLDLKSLVAIMIMLGLAVSISPQTAPTNSPEYGPYDRITAMRKFLLAVYPQLRQEVGTLSMHTQELNSGGGPTIFLDFVPCPPPVSNPGPPRCVTISPSHPSSFLSMEVWFGSSKYPILHFYAYGQGVDKEYQILNKELAAHPDWGLEEKAEAIKRAAPKFSAENRAEFLKTIPFEAIFKFSGCRLDLSSAGHGDATANYWTVWGEIVRSPELADRQCSAAFEPFRGNLVALDAF
jgi:hypothetical protein